MALTVVIQLLDMIILYDDYILARITLIISIESKKLKVHFEYTFRFQISSLLDILFDNH